MKQGKDIVSLAQELRRIETTKKDFKVPVELMSMNDKGKLSFTNGATHEFSLNNWSAGQVAAFTEIPKAYFDKIRTENPALLAQNVNHGLTRAKQPPRLVRTLDGHVRGFLSDTYRMIDAHDILESILPVLIDLDFKVVSSEITEQRLYLKTTTEKVQGEVKQGDVVQYGVVVSTSDVGAGSLRIEPYMNRLVCLNGMIMSTTFRKFHRQGRGEFSDEIQELMSDRTKALNDAALFATMKDYLAATMKPEIFQKEINKMRQAANAPIKNMDLNQVIELSMNKVGIRGEETKKSILAALANGNEGAGLTQWGLANSFTRAAQADFLDYEQATALEKAGGDIIELQPGDWKKIADTPL